MAEVYLAKNNAAGIGKFVAMKRILPHFCEKQEFLDMFKDEAKIAVNLNHGNIVTIHEFGIERNQLFLVMDYVEGRNLRQILNKMKKTNTTFSIEQVVYIIREVASGLDHAHRCIDGSTGRPLNITHRDMSPQNVMLSFEGEVKIVDFGIAKAETQLDTTQAGTLKGKFGYMSPEQAEGQVVDLRTDIFSLGIVLWELLANDRLFVAKDEISTLRKIRDCQIPSLRKINPNIPQELERICNKALSKDKNLRYQSAASFYRDLHRFLNTKFPDFSKHDFSVFIKTLFAPEIQEARKKLIEYAKVDLPPAEVPPSPATEPTRTMTHTERHPDEEPNVDFHGRPLGGGATPLPKVASPPPLAPSVAPERSPAAAAPTPAPQPKPKKSGKPRSRSARLNLDDQGFQREITRPRGQSPFGVRENSLVNTNVGTIPGIRNTYAGSSYHYYERKDNQRWQYVISGVVMVALLISALAYYQNPVQNRIKISSFIDKVLKGRASPRSLPYDGQTTQASNGVIEYNNLRVVSNPSGAEIWIDGVKQNDVTPGVVPVPKNKPIVLKLVVPGHEDFDGLIQSKTQDLSVSADLKTSSRSAGTLNIQVHGEGEIWVDGRKAANGGPLNGYRVPANREVKVEVFDQKTNSYASWKNYVSTNEIKTITLIPMPRSPSSVPPNSPGSR